MDIFITLGSNIEPETNLPRAIKALRRQMAIRAASRVYRTAALDAEGQPNGQADFLNAAVLAEVDDHVSAVQIKYEMLRPIETSLGRVRGQDKYAARTIDLDLALYGRQIISSAEIELPDPEILTRAHVALPLADLDPNFVHPVSGQTLGAIAQGLCQQAEIAIDPLTLD